MTTASAMQGTRMGRKVEDPSKVIAEIEEQTRAAEGKAPAVIIPSTETGAPTSIEDVFKFARLERLANGWSLVDLEVSDGYWKRITLFDQPIATFLSHYPQTLYELSEGKKEIKKDGVILDHAIPIEPPDHIIPARAMYWFMRAAMYGSAQVYSTLRDHIRDIEGKRIVAEEIEYTKSGNLLGNLYFSKASIKTRGWPSLHPLIQSFQTTPTALHITSYTLRPGTFCEPLVSSLLGDPDMDRVVWNFKHIFCVEYPVCLDVPNLDSFKTISSAVRFKVKNLEGPGKPYNCIDAAVGNHFTNALTIRADAGDFTARKVEP